MRTMLASQAKTRIRHLVEGVHEGPAGAPQQLRPALPPREGESEGEGEGEGESERTALRCLHSTKIFIKGPEITGSDHITGT